jgi:hypothetical protein
MVDDTKGRVIGSIVGLIMAFIGLVMSVSKFSDFHNNTFSLGIWLAIYIAGTIIAFVSVTSPSP